MSKILHQKPYKKLTSYIAILHQKYYTGKYHISYWKNITSQIYIKKSYILYWKILHHISSSHQNITSYTRKYYILNLHHTSKILLRKVLYLHQKILHFTYTAECFTSYTLHWRILHHTSYITHVNNREWIGIEETRIYVNNSCNPFNKHS